VVSLKSKLLYLISRLCLSLCTLSIFYTNPSLANVHVLPRNRQHLHPKTTQETLQKVQGAELAYVNYFALKRDIPELQSFSHSEIDSWVLKNFSYVSANQNNLIEIRNSPIPWDQQKKTGLRPPRYGRAGVVEGLSQQGGQDKDKQDKVIGLVDIKGIGISELRLEGSKDRMAGKTISQIRDMDHSDGLMSLGEAIAELTRQTAAQKLFNEYNQKNKTHFETVETYFILALPFDILKGNGEKIPAALYGRQPHIGRANFYGVPKKIYIDDHGFLQQDYFDAAVDFGGVLVTDERLKHNFEVREGGKTSNPQDSKPWAWGHQVANAFRQGDKDVVRRHLTEMLSPINLTQEENPTTPTRKSFEQEIEEKFLEYLKGSNHENLVKMTFLLPYSKTPHWDKIVQGFLSHPLLGSMNRDRFISLWLENMTTQEQALRISEIYDKIPTSVQQRLSFLTGITPPRLCRGVFKIKQ